ncbi:MAG: hypothetical protein K2X27_02800 [Candidatus Obscuribacterales bacterium]|nr:hypothetical protein [Candidatus Obscuribacterales bacterium]
MIVSTASTASFVAAPKVELQPAPEQLPKVDLHHVAYFRDETQYDDLYKALMQKISNMQKQIAVLSNR